MAVSVTNPDPHKSALSETSWIRIRLKDPDTGGKKRNNTDYGSEEWTWLAQIGTFLQEKFSYLFVYSFSMDPELDPDQTEAWIEPGSVLFMRIRNTDGSKLLSELDDDESNNLNTFGSIPISVKIVFSTHERTQVPNMT